MYLHEQLLEICKNVEIINESDIISLNGKIINACENYYKSRLHVGMSRKEAKSIFDKTFNLFDLFVMTAIKSNEPLLVAIGKMYKDNNFKSMFLKTDELAKLYNSL